MKEEKRGSKLPTGRCWPGKKLKRAMRGNGGARLDAAKKQKRNKEKETEETRTRRNSGKLGAMNMVKPCRDSSGDKKLTKTTFPENHRLTASKTPVAEIVG